MPIYEYECEKCGHGFEREQRISDAPIKTCPKCKARRVKKLISLSSFSLKGGGWYADGYSDSKAAKSDTTETPSASSTPSAAASTSSDSDKPKPSEKKESPKPAADSKKSKAKNDKSAA